MILYKLTEVIGWKVDVGGTFLSCMSSNNMMNNLLWNAVLDTFIRPYQAF